MDVVFLSDRDKTCTKVLRTVRSPSWWKFSYPKNQNPQLSPNLSKCFKNTFSELKASFWYLIHSDRTCGSEFFTQIGVKLAQKCSERRDLQICENFLTSKNKVRNFHQITTNVFKKFSHLEGPNPHFFTQSLQMFQNDILRVKSIILVPDSPGSDKWKWAFHSDGGKTCIKVFRMARSATLWKFSDPKYQNPQFSPNHSKCFKNTFYELKASLWYFNQPDRTSWSGFFSKKTG